MSALSWRESGARALWIAVISVMLSACEAPKERLIGAWSVDITQLREEPIARLAAPPAGPLAQGIREAAYRDWRFTFHADESLEATLRGQRYQGRYVISQILSGTIYMRLEGASSLKSGLDEQLGLKTLELPPLSERVIITLQRGDRATLSFEQGMSIPLRRRRAGI